MKEVLQIGILNKIKMIQSVKRRKIINYYHYCRQILNSQSGFEYKVSLHTDYWLL